MNALMVGDFVVISRTRVGIVIADDQERSGRVGICYADLPTTLELQSDPHGEEDTYVAPNLPTLADVTKVGWANADEVMLKYRVMRSSPQPTLRENR